MSRKLTITEMHDLAEERGGFCLSKKYINCITHLKWKCSKGHTWKAKPNNIKNGRWCPECSINKMKKYSIVDMQNLAKLKEGKCISKVYKNNITEMKWECKEGHQWYAIPDQIRRGNWCPTCAGVKPLTIQDMHKLARKNKGKCLSKEYKNANTHLDWECSEGHQWKAMPRTIKSGSWCKKCYWGISIEDAKKLAKKMNGKCLSKTYKNTFTKLHWKCNKGHEWEATYTSIRTGHWCPHCSNKKIRTIQDCHDIAKKHGGKCLSKQYLTAKTPMRWQCKRGHRWVVASQNIFYRGDWCRECAFIEIKKGKGQTEYKSKNKQLKRCLSGEAKMLKKKLAKNNITFQSN